MLELSFEFLCYKYDLIFENTFSTISCQTNVEFFAELKIEKNLKKTRRTLIFL